MRTGRQPKRAVVLDRDGTLINLYPYLSDPAQVELIPGITSGLRRLQQMGLELVLVTNQSGIGRGLFDRERLTAVHARLCDLLELDGVHLGGIYFCPHVPEARCRCRKPETELVECAARDLYFDPSASFVVGDNVCDMDLGDRMGATAILVRSGYGEQVLADGLAGHRYTVEHAGKAASLIERLLMASSCEEER